MTSTNPRAVIGNNLPPDPFALIQTEINDLFDTAKDFCDGEAIASQEMHDTIEKLFDALHEAGKRADAMRVDEKRPLDEQVQAIQDKYNPLIQPKKGKVALGKDACASLLAPWRKRIADEKAAVAAAARVEADRIAAEAQAAIRASSGNLAARQEAEALLQEAKAVERTAKRADRQATTGTGLRSVWKAALTDVEAALDYYYPRNPTAFAQMVEELARVDVSIGVRTIPGFVVTETKVATV